MSRKRTTSVSRGALKGKLDLKYPKLFDINKKN